MRPGVRQIARRTTPAGRDVTLVPGGPSAAPIPESASANEPAAQFRPKLERPQDALSPWDLAGTDQVMEADARTRQMVGGTDLPGNRSLNCFAYWRLPMSRQSTFTERGMPA